MVAGNDSYILFKVKDLFCTLNSLDVQEIIRNSNNITAVKQSPSYIEGVINLRGQIVTIFNLSKFFEFKSSENKDDTIIIANHDGEHFGFLISEIKDIVTVNNSHIENSSVLPQSINKEYIERVLSVNKELYSLLNIENIVEPELV